MQIFVNGKPFNLASPVPAEITQLSIVSNPMQPTFIKMSQAEAAKAKFKQLLEACTCQYFWYNGIFTKPEDLLAKD